MKSQRWIPTWIGRVAFLIGLFNILANVNRRFKGPSQKVSHYLPTVLNGSATATSILVGFALMVLARGLIRRKKRAWLSTVIIIGVGIVSQTLRGRFHHAQVIILILLFIVLMVTRKSFYAVSDPATKYQPLIAFAIGSVLLFITSFWLLAYRHGDQITGDKSVKNVSLFVLEGFFGIKGPLTFSSDRTADVLYFTLTTFGIFIIGIPILLYFRRVQPIEKMSQQDLEIVKLLIRHDSEQDSLGYFATRKDKSVVWTENKKAGIAYRVQGGVMLASGDPFGEYSLWPDAIKEFLTLAEMHAWTPAVMGCSDRGGEVWVEHAGMIAIDIGDEAIISIADFTLEGRPMSNVRQMVNRIARKGYITTTTKWSEVDPETRTKLRKLGKEWRYGVAERGFSMSMDRFGEDEDTDTYITIAYLAGEIKGLLYFVPWTTNALSLDRMQRERGTDAGVNELMIADTVAWGRANGITHISLNFAAFRSLFERADKISAGPVTRGMRNLIRFFSNFFQVESLYRFNAKFQPEWETRYVLYPRAADLAKVGWAALRAEKFIRGFRKN
jgi:lysyl-tRNA synthetase, class II